MRPSKSEALQKHTTQQPFGSAPVKINRRQELDAFWREHNDSLLAYVYNWVGSRADAADIVQEAYCRLFRLGGVHAVRHLRGYLFKAAKNIATDLVRQRVVRDGFAQDELLRGNVEDASPEHIWLAREELEAVQRDIDALPPKCRRALIKVKVQGASYEEVATELGIKTHSARRLVERANECLVEAGKTHSEEQARKTRANSGGPSRSTEKHGCFEPPVNCAAERSTNACEKYMCRSCPDSRPHRLNHVHTRSHVQCRVRRGEVFRLACSGKRLAVSA